MATSSSPPSTAASTSTKVEATYSRMQPLFERLSLLVAAHGQYAATRCCRLSCAAMAAARSGARSIRQRSSLDECINVLGELRLDLPHNVKQ